MKRTAALAITVTLFTFGTAHANDAGLNWFMANDIIQKSPGISRQSLVQYELIRMKRAHLEGGSARFSSRDGYVGGNGSGMNFSFSGGKGGCCTDTE